MSSPALNKPQYAAVWMLGALASFSAMAVAAREVSSDLSTFQILFFRTAVALLILAVIVPFCRDISLRTPQPGVHLLRHCAHFAGQYGWFLGIALIPLAQVFALEFTVPIWAAIIAALILGERLTIRRCVAIGLGFIGVLIILRPGLGIMQPAALIVLAGAMAYGLSHTLTRKLTSTDHPLTILVYMNLIQLPLAAGPALWHWHWPAAALWPCLIAIGATALTAHYCLAKALSLADAAVVVPMDFLRLPLIALIGWWVYGELLDPFIMLGAALMFVGVYLNIRADLRRLRV